MFVLVIEKEGVKIVVRKGEIFLYVLNVFESVFLKEIFLKFELVNINSCGIMELGDIFYWYVKFDFYFF